MNSIGVKMDKYLLIDYLEIFYNKKININDIEIISNGLTNSQEEKYKFLIDKCEIPGLLEYINYIIPIFIFDKNRTILGKSTASSTGVTYVDNGMYFPITIYHEKDNLYERIQVHELIHSIRLNIMNIQNITDYLKYTSIETNLIFEEVIAYSMEKILFNLSLWTDVYGIQYRSNKKEFIAIENIYIRTYEELQEIIKYYTIEQLSYYICMMYNTDKNIFKIIESCPKDGYKKMGIRLEGDK